MSHRRKTCFGAFGVTLIAAACSASPADVRQADAAQVVVPPPAKGSIVTDPERPPSQRFRTLDEYLLFLERTQATVDGPWYREIRPGVYELQSGGNLHDDAPTTGQRTFTRDELERKFGFKK